MTTNAPKLVGIYCIVRAILLVIAACGILSISNQIGVGGSAFASATFLSLGIAFALVVIASGLFQAKPWAWTGTMVYFGLEAVLTVLGGCSKFRLDIVNIVFLVIAAAILYIFSSDPVKQVFGKGR